MQQVELMSNFLLIYVPFSNCHVLLAVPSAAAPIETIHQLSSHVISTQPTSLQPSGTHIHVVCVHGKCTNITNNQNSLLPSCAHTVVHVF